MHLGNFMATLTAPGRGGDYHAAARVRHRERRLLNLFHARQYNPVLL